MKNTFLKIIFEVQTGIYPVLPPPLWAPSRTSITHAWLTYLRTYLRNRARVVAIRMRIFVISSVFVPIAEHRISAQKPKRFLSPQYSSPSIPSRLSSKSFLSSSFANTTTVVFRICTFRFRAHTKTKQLFLAIQNMRQDTKLRGRYLI